MESVLDKDENCPKTKACPHNGNCSRRDISHWTIVRGIILKLLPIDILDILRFNFVNYMQVFYFNNLRERDLYEFKKHWPKSVKFPLLTPDKIFVLSDEQIESDFYGFVPDGRYQDIDFDVYLDFDGVSVPRNIPEDRANYILMKYYHDILHSFNPIGKPDKERENLKRPEIAFDKRNPLSRMVGFSFFNRND